MKKKRLLFIGLILCLVCFDAMAEIASKSSSSGKHEVISDRIKTINEEIEYLNDVVEKYYSLANMRDRRAQKYMLSDWASYTREMEAAADYNKLAQETENTISELEKFKIKLQLEEKK